MKQIIAVTEASLICTPSRDLMHLGKVFDHIAAVTGDQVRGLI